MDCDENNGDHNEMWEWRGTEFDLQRDPLNDTSHCFWGEVNEDANDLFYMFNDQTPIKDCTDFDYQVSDAGGGISNKELECGEASQFKRRRMLQFTAENNETMDCSMMGEGLMQTVEWNSGDKYALSCEGLDQSSEGWFAKCLNESEANCCSEEMNNSMAPIDQVDVSEFHKVSPEIEADGAQENSIPVRPRVFKGRKSFIEAPTKLTTSIAYPFALIKPCGVHGDVTLNDINQWIHNPPSSKFKNKKDEESNSYPTSAFSGKPVVVKTKIRTDGGKGSITIMRTRG
ncbi:protein XRI1-like isoform X2 [Ananas comosus]|uniref:Protein XRI1-like isoform X2 n=1 Tax=Ananas comosus TaxID=4615 RepID=A0A6P5F6Q2_ANACO|nr:protein XRI1-like isoform X2 [Ananas comosus]